VSSSCPTTCREHATFQKELLQRECTEGDDDSQSMINAYLRGLQSYNQSIPLPWRPDVTVMYNKVSKGCAEIVKPLAEGEMIWPIQDFCEISESWYLQPLAWACPVSCECDLRPRGTCPPSCLSSTMGNQSGRRLF
jgi:hypothetical protein